jgi:hypothetical protein
VGGGIADFTFIIQHIFMTKKYELKNISKFVINIWSSAECHFKEFKDTSTKSTGFWLLHTVTYN